jgi:flagellar basal-body rod modification protein FlgD
MDIRSLTGDFAARGPLPGSSGQGAGVFSSDGFLKLLAAQIGNQNPLEPMKDTEFIAQMAQFSQLEQTTNLARDIRSLTMGQQLSQGAALIGREVTYETADGRLARGAVERLWVSADGREMRLAVGGTAVEIGQIVTVES